MASGHVNRVNRPNTWLHRPSLRREVFPCQLGAVHTWHFAPLVVRPLSVRRDHGAESAAAQPARPNVTTLPVALRLSVTASTWAAQASSAARFSAAQSWQLIDPGDAGAAAADVVQHRFPCLARGSHLARRGRNWRSCFPGASLKRRWSTIAQGPTMIISMII